MAVFGKKTPPLEIVYYKEEVKQLSDEVAGLIEQVNLTIAKLTAANEVLIQSRKDMDKSIAKMQAIRRLPRVGPQ